MQLNDNSSITPLVSVVVATYRRKEELKRALESLAKQTYPYVEVILVDDNDDIGWNHEVELIEDAVREKFPSIKICLVVNHPNLGSARARNAGIEKANGEYVTFLDDDDIYLPEKIEKQVSAMIAENADYCITDLELYDENEKCVDRRTREYIVSHDAKQLLTYHLMYHMTGTDTMMFRTEYLRQVGGFPPIDIGDEFYLMYEAIVGGGRFLYLPGCHVKAYVHPTGGLSSGDQKIQGENELYRFKKKFFDEIDSKSRRYIRMRHHAVLTFVHWKNKKTTMFIKHACFSLFSDPGGCIKILKFGR